MSAIKRTSPKKPEVDTGIPLNASRILDEAKERGLYIWFEPNKNVKTGKVRWCVFDRKTGQEIGQYYPDPRTMTLKGQEGFRQVRDWREALWRYSVHVAGESVD